MVLDMAIAWDFWGHWVVRDLGVDVFDPLQLARTVELQVLKIAMRHVLVQLPTVETEAGAGEREEGEESGEERSHYWSWV